jgi:hypothetical protein
MISFLRNQKIPIFQDKAKEQDFYDELDFWGIPLNLNYGNSFGNMEIGENG